LSEIGLASAGFANELILLRDGYLRLSTDMNMTRSDINSISWHRVALTLDVRP